MDAAPCCDKANPTKTRRTPTDKPNSTHESHFSAPSVLAALCVRAFALITPSLLLKRDPAENCTAKTRTQLNAPSFTFCPLHFTKGRFKRPKAEWCVALALIPTRAPTTHNALKAVDCACAAVFYRVQQRNLVEEKSVLDCRRISRKLQP